MHTGLRHAAALAVAATVLTGCTLPAASTGEQIRISPVPGVAVDRPRLPDATPSVPGLVDGLPGGDLTPYVAQQPAWSDCGRGTQCAEVLAPLDYADPSAKAVTLSLRRKPATQAPRLGTLFVNPGGPGGSGKAMVPGFHTAGLEQYDILGWDPRGTGDSTSVRCLGRSDTEAYLNLDSTPDDDAERTALLRGNYAFAKACWQNSGELLEHISTVETVRDLDLLRRIVGDDELHYLGYSYGTEIGATYAEVFGPKTGRLVLDAAVNITDDHDVIQAMGFDLALGNFAAWCAKQSCALGASKQAVLDSVTGLFDRLDGSPVAVGQRRLTQSLAVTGVAALLYGGTDAWPAIAASVTAARAGNGKALLAAADSLNSRDAAGNYGRMLYAFPAISCLDSDDDRGVLDADRTWAQDRRKAPIFGKYFGPQYGCALWPVRPASQLELRGAAAKPLLVIGGTGDNATPYQQAVEMARQLQSGVLVTYNGEGHGTYGGKSACVDRIVVDYLVNGTVPKDGVECD